MHRCEQSAHIDAYKTHHTAYTTVSLRMRQQKLNINLEYCAFLFFILYNYNTIPGAKNITKIQAYFGINHN